VSFCDVTVRLPPAFDAASTLETASGLNSETSLFLITDFAYLAFLLDWAQNFSMTPSLPSLALVLILLLFLRKASYLFEFGGF